MVKPAHPEDDVWCVHCASWIKVKNFYTHFGSNDSPQSPQASVPQPESAPLSCQPDNKDGQEQPQAPLDEHPHTD